METRAHPSALVRLAARSRTVLSIAGVAAVAFVSMSDAAPVQGATDPAAQLADRAATAMSRFAAALGGAYGDEGPAAHAALDALAAVLSECDQVVNRVEAEVTAAPPDEQSRRLMELGRVQLACTRTASALGTFERAERLSPTSSAPLLAGLVQQSLGRSSDAATSFLRAWRTGAADPVAAYLLLQGDAEVTGDTDRVRATDLLRETYRAALTPERRGRMAPFPVLPTPFSAAGGAVILPAAYAAGQARFVAGEWDAAIEAWRAAARVDPLLATAPPEANLSQGSAALRAAQLESAREHFERALRTTPASSEAHRLIGTVRFLGGDIPGSADALRRAIELDPRDERSRIMLARVQSGSGRLDAAEATLRQTLVVMPDSALASLALAGIAERLNRDEEAASLYASVAARQRDAGAATLLVVAARLHDNSGDRARAHDAWLRSARADPNNPQTRNELARSYLDRDEPDRAFMEYAAALLIDPADANAFMGVGQLRLSAGDYEGAVAPLRRLVALHPDYVEARHALGNALLRAGHEEEGTRELAEFTRLQALKADAARRHLQLTVLKEEARLRASEGAWDRAASLWQQVLDAEPALAANHAALGAVFAGAGRLDDALAHLQRAIALGPAPDVYDQLAAVLARLDRHAESAAARRQFERLLLMPPAGTGP